MSDRNWEAELAKIDKQLNSISDDQLVAEQRAALTKPAALPAGKGVPAAAPAAGKAAAPTGRVAGTWTSWVKVLLAVVGAAGLMAWPWPNGCGIPLVGFTAATGLVALLGVWSAIGTWRHRLGLAHFASLLVILWGLALGAREVLPRVGYALPTAERGADWQCVLPPPPAGTTPTTTTPPAATPSTAPAATPQG